MSKRLLGVLIVAGAGVLLAAIVIAIVISDNGTFSPLNGFVTELGRTAAPSAVVFNAGMILFGLSLCVFIVGWGIRQNSGPHAVVGFFGILTGTLAAAQAVFTLDSPPYHYVATAAFYSCVFVFGTLYIVVELMAGRSRGIAAVLVAFFAAISGAVFAVFMFTGGMARVFVEDASMVGRAVVLPFAVIGWLSLLLLMALAVLLGLDMLELDVPSRQVKRMVGRFQKNTRDIEL